jgi:hypothetical protein
MNQLKKFAASLVLLAGLAGLSFGQTALTQTTLASAVFGPAGYSGTSSTISGTVTLASCTGIAAPILPGTPSSIIYVGREAMGVFTVNTTSCTLTVNRGYLGTQAAPHPSGDMVLYGPNYAVTLAQGGNPVPSGLFQQDPPVNGTCTAANTPTTPWINVLTGAQWLCSTVTGTWVPGWQNPWITDGAWQTATVPAAAGTITPSGPLFVVSGSGAITGFNIPVGCDATAVGGCSFTVISAAGSTWTWTAAGNIMTAGTGTAGHLFTFVWSASLLKFVPSSLS